MAEFIFISCPNCKVEIKIDREKKYHDCSECGFEFRSDQIDLPEQLKAPASSLLKNLAKLQSDQ